MAVTCLIFSIAFPLLITLERSRAHAVIVEKTGTRAEQVIRSLSVEDPGLLPALGDLVQTYAAQYPGGRMVIMDAEEEVLADSSLSSGELLLSQKSKTRTLSGKTAWEIRDRVLYAVAPLRGKDQEAAGFVVGMIPVKLLKQETGDILRTVLPFIFLLILLAYAAYVVITLRRIRPLFQINDWLKRKSDGQIMLKPETEYKDEYQQIIDSVETMTGEMMDLDSNRRTFVSNVSHELKTPLSSMKVLTESLLLQDGVPEATYKEFLGDINQELDRQNALISDLLTLVRLDEGENRMNISVCDLGEMAEQIRKRLSPLAREQQVELKLEIRETVLLQCDEMKLTLALSNLIENAVKYNHPGGVVVVRIDAGVREALIDVADTGIGIPKEDFNRIFDRFYRVGQARDRGTGGTGLGLSIVRQVIVLHHGSIALESMLEQGTTFHVRIPLKYTENREAVQHEE